MSKKEAILSAATRLFGRKGYNGTAMAELSRTTGAASGTIFHHFKNKEDLFVHILKDIQETVVSKFEHHFSTRKYKTGLEMVEGAAGFYLQLAGTMEDQFLLLHRHFPYELAQSNPVCRRHLQAIYDCLLDIFERGIAAGQADGSVDKAPPRNTAMILFSMVDGIARLNTYNLYDAGALVSTLLNCCRRILKNRAAVAP